MGAWTSVPRQSNPSDGEPIDYEKLKGYLDNLAHTAINKKAVLQQLSTAVDLLTATNATFVEEIKGLTANIKYLCSLARSTNTAKPGKGEEKCRWKKANPVCFIIGGD